MESRTLETARRPHQDPRLRGRRAARRSLFLPRRRRPAAGRPVPRGARAALPRRRAAAARLRGLGRRRQPAHDARRDALGLRRGRRPRPRAADRRRPLDGRHDRRRDGGALPARRARASRCSRRPVSGSTRTRSRTCSPLLPFELPALLFHDVALRREADDRRTADGGRRAGQGRSTSPRCSQRFEDSAFLQAFLLDQARRLGTRRQAAVPDPRARPRRAPLPRARAKTLLVWGESDRLIRSGLRRRLPASPARTPSSCASRRPATWRPTSSPTR